MKYFLVRPLSPSHPAKPLLLLVDDDPLISDSLGFALARDFEVLTSHSRPHCLQILRQLKAVPGAAIVDLGLPPLPHRPDEGFALIGDLLAFAPAMKIVVLSGQNGEENARHARTLGAIDFVGKPCDPGDLLRLLRQALRFTGGTEAARAPEERCRLIGSSLPIQRLLLQIGQYGDYSFPVLVEGESGSGKDVVATCCLHHRTRRRDRPFLALNCAAISPSLVEPTLFGYAKGAFTGAGAAKSGYFEDAGEGTLFLDEIGELPLDLQPKLLRVLENGEYQRVGETQTRRSRARIVAATNRDLRKEVKAGRFRADLFHRLSVFTISVPPLRDMGDDRLLLLDHFRQIYAEQTGARPFSLDAGAEALWVAYVFPGNVRELRNIVIRLTAKYPGRVVGAAELHAEFDEGDESPASAPSLAATDLDTAVRSATRHLIDKGRMDLDATLALWEKGYIEAALQLSNGNVSQAARRLGINRTTLYNRMAGGGRQ